MPNPNELLTPSEFANLIEDKNKGIQLLKEIKEKLEKYLIIDLNSFTATIEGEPIGKNFDRLKGDALKATLASGMSRAFLKWELNAILAGKQGGGFKAVWENLINLIEVAQQLSSDIAPLIIGKKLETTKENLTEKNIEILKEIKAHMGAGKKINRLSLLIHKEWKNVIEAMTINSKELSTAEDCEIAISIINLAISRNEIGELWTELIEKHDGISFTEFGDEPEQSCISFVPQIKYCLNWYSDTYVTLKDLVIDCGLSQASINPTTQYTYPIQEVEYLIALMYLLVPQYITLADIIYVTLPSITRRLQEDYKKIEAHSSKSETCSNILYAIKNEDASQYKNYYEKLELLYAKYFYQSERSRILKVISEYAPQWAKLIESRAGIHGWDIVPEDIADAWKWKQFLGIIEEITHEPFEALQHKSVALNASLRKATSELAENSAWYHLLSRIEGDISQKQALQGWKLTTKKIGKGTGKMAPKFKKEAQKLMAQCQKAVPAWIMTINKALESLDPTKNKFDIVIIDEASQSDISALAIMYLAKKIIIVGDDEQVSPSAVGLDIDKMSNLSDMYIEEIIPNAHLYDMKSSLYDIAKTTFPTLMLREHFRCVPSIIGYSNRLSYDYKIKPLRDDSNVRVKPATVAYRVDGQRNKRKSNEIEAKSIVALMLSCMAQAEYDGMTFGVISLLGDEQARVVNDLAIEKISPQDYEKRQILCGNASSFQGDERDIIFISLVDSNPGEGPLRMTGEGAGNATKQRYNVAVSRARNQIWVVHSLDVNNDLKSGDMRKGLIEYVTNPSDFDQQACPDIIKL